ncbi:MAG TPA: ATP-binding protein [Terriglobales bacterium]|nr:ATP-binding protein [Terriglobales bacterium]
MSETSHQAVAYLCDAGGNVRRKLRDHLGCPELSAGEPLSALVLNGGAERLAEMLAAVRRSGGAFDWELSVSVQGRPETLHFAAAADGDDVLVIGGRTRYETVRLFEQLAGRESARTEALRQAIRQEAARRREWAGRATEFFAEISRLTQELAETHKELAHKDSLLEVGSQALAESENQFRTVFEYAGDTIVVLNDEGRFLRANPAAERIFGLPPAQLTGKTISEFIELGPVARRIGIVFRKAERREGQFALRDVRGRVVHVEYTATPDFIPGRHLMILRDVSQRKRHEAEIHELNQSLERRVAERTRQLEQINRELEAFSYSVSHDLRAPFRHMMGYAELLLKRLDAADETTRHYAASIAEAGQHAGQLVDNLLDFSHTARHQLQRVAVDTPQLVEDVRLEVTSADAKGRRVYWRVSELPSLYADEAMLRQVFRNLFSNALKFTRSRDDAVIEVGCHDDADEVIVFVRDNGVGFDMHYVDKLFGVFQRLHKVEEFEGTGIGLANVRRIVQRHGGRAWATGAPNRGATIYFSIPKRIEDKEQSA